MAKTQARRRRPTKKSTTRRRKPSTKKMEVVASQVYDRKVETHKKQFVVNEQGITMVTAPIGYKVLADESYVLQQGDGYSNMSGHIVNAVGHKADIYFHNNNTNYDVFGRLIWIYSRTNVLPDDVSIYLTEGNNGDTSLSNNLLELHQRINKEQFLVMRNWDFKLGRKDGQQALSNCKHIKHYHMHKGRKMIYNGTNTYPINGRFFYVVMFRRMDNDGAPVDGIEYSAVHNFYFKNA